MSIIKLMIIRDLFLRQLMGIIECSTSIASFHAGGIVD